MKETDQSHISNEGSMYDGNIWLTASITSLLSPACSIIFANPTPPIHPSQTITKPNPFFASKTVTYRQALWDRLPIVSHSLGS